MILAALSQNPSDYYELVESYYQVLENKYGQESDFDECVVKNGLRNVSRFNGITLDGIFGLWWADWGSCDLWVFTPEIEPPQPCAATQAVVGVVEEGVEGVSMTPEEGEALLEKIRTIRDEYLLNSVRGRYYAFLYSTCSDEIIEIILGNPQITLTALDLMEDAALKLENLDAYISSGASPIDEDFVFLTMIILEELKAHTSLELLNSVAVVEGDLMIMQGMTVEEVFEFFELEQ